MVELTEREIKITHIFLTILNRQYDQVPQNIKEGLLAATLKIRGFEFNEQELIDIVNALNDEQTLIIQNTLGFFAKHQDAFKAIKTLRL